MPTKLSRHIAKCHKDAERVNALKLDRKLQIAEFRMMKCDDGIVAFNKDEATKENRRYQKERKHRKYLELTRCSSCSAFVSKHFSALIKSIA